MRGILTVASLLAAVSVASIATPAAASLSLFQQFSGNYGLSTDGAGTTGDGYSINAWAPFGATVVGAWLYQTTNSTNTLSTITLNGNAVTFGLPVLNTDACCSLTSARADVTSIVKPIIDAGLGGAYSFNVTETSTIETDGTALVVIYADPTAPVRTLAILDGFSLVSGDGFSFLASDPLDPAAAGFEAELRLGSSFSCCDQQSSVTVNGTLISSSAGNFDDGAELANGSLITVGGNDDPFSPHLPSYANDHERYNLTPYITAGDTSITVRTANSSRDDNIFLAAFIVSGEGRVVGPVDAIPEPAAWMLMIAGFGLVGFAVRRRKENGTVAA